MIPAAVVALILAQASVPVEAVGEATGGDLLKLCGRFEATKAPSWQDVACLGYVSGLMDAIADYESSLRIARTFDTLLHASMYARVGELPQHVIDSLRKDPANSLATKNADALAKMQAEAIASGAAKRARVFPDWVGDGIIQNRVCVPSGATTEQVALIIVKFLRDHPEDLHKPRGIVAMNAIEAAFPCSGQKAAQQPPR